MRYSFISLLVFIMVFSLVGCGTSSTKPTYKIRDYEDYQERLIFPNELYQQEEENYDVYFFSYYCDACYNLKEYLFDYLDENNDIYLCNISEFDFLESDFIFSETRDELVLGVSEIKDTYFRKSPVIYSIRMKDGVRVLDSIHEEYQEVFEYFARSKKLVRRFDYENKY